MKYRTVSHILWFLMFAFSTAIASAAQETNKSPNILLILTDNTGWGDWGAYGGGQLRGAPSPNIDKIAAEGMRLLNFNTEPQCTPSRSALMTGRHAIRSGTQSVPLGDVPYGLLPWEITIAEALKEKAPDVLAKTSISADAKVPPGREPWILEGVAGQPIKKAKPFDLEARRRIDAELTTRTIDFIQRQVKSSKPFFAYVPLTAMHYPTLPHPDFAGKSGHGEYADMLVQTDAYVGQILAALDKLGVSRDTFVIFTADNGIEDPNNGDGQYSGWSGPWAGTYFTAMEGGLRVPFILRWPGKVPAGSVNNEIAHLVDIFPTLAKWTGARVPTDRPIDGIDMTDFFSGKRSQSGREGFAVYVADDLRAVKWHDWKVHYAWQETKYSPIQRYSTVPKIIDLSRDPRETRQVAEPYNTWIQFPIFQLLGKLQGSMKKFPNIPVGSATDFTPNYTTDIPK